MYTVFDIVDTLEDAFASVFRFNGKDVLHFLEQFNLCVLLVLNAYSNLQYKSTKVY
jgi:hypothetical protein